jgi:hypothetical protein
VAAVTATVPAAATPRAGERRPADVAVFGSRVADALGRENSGPELAGLALVGRCALAGHHDPLRRR